MPTLDSDFFENLLVQPDNFLLVHLLMQIAVVCIRLCGLPTAVFLTRVDTRIWRFVKSEVKGFSRMDFTTDSFAEVFIWNLTVPIRINPIEKLFELFIWDLHAPEAEHRSKLVSFDRACLFYVQISECFTQCLPLVLNFGEDLGLKFSIVAHITHGLFELLSSFLVLDLLPVKLGIFARIVSEVKPFRLVDRAANPPWKIWVAEKSFLLCVLVSNQLFEVIVVNLEVSSKESHEIFDSYIPVIVRVKR